MKINNFEKKKTIPLTNEEHKSYFNQINCHICKKDVKINTLMIKIIINFKIMVIIEVNTEVLHIAYVT